MRFLRQGFCLPPVSRRLWRESREIPEGGEGDGDGILASRREGFAAAVIPSGGPGKDRGATRAFDGRYDGRYEEVMHGRELTHGVSLVPFAYVTLVEKGCTAVESG